MTQEDKELLLKELCGRLPWGVNVQYDNQVYAIDYVSAEYEEVKLDILDNYTVGISDIKPYLRPMNSMTDEEMAERISILYELEGHIEEDVTYKYQDWLNAHHLDYRGLIHKDLAIEAPKDMYKL